MHFVNTVSRLVAFLMILAIEGLRSYFTANVMQANLVLCIGVALILAAFGGQTTVRVGSIIMAGVAAIVLGLFVYMQSSSRNLFLPGTIDDLDFNAYSLNMGETNQILGIPVPNPDNWSRSRFEFVIFNNDIHGPTIKVALASRAPTLRPSKSSVWQSNCYCGDPFCLAQAQRSTRAAGRH